MAEYIGSLGKVAVPDFEQLDAPVIKAKSRVLEFGRRSLRRFFRSLGVGGSLDMVVSFC